MSLLDFTASPILRLLSKRKKQPEEIQHEKIAMLDALRRLTRQPDWQEYRKLLDANVSAQVQAMLASASDSEIHRLRGYIQGLLHSVQFAENLVTQDDNARERKQRSAAADADRAESQRSALYATGHWGN